MREIYSLRQSVYTSDVNDAEILMPSRDFWLMMPSRVFHFRNKKRARAETLANEPEPSRYSNKTIRAESRI